MGNDNSSLSFENYQNVQKVMTKETLVEYMEERIQKRYKALLKRVDKNADGVVSKDELQELYKGENKQWLKEMFNLNSKGGKDAKGGKDSCDKLFNLYSKNGVVDKDSMVAGMKIALDKKLQKVVKHADKDADHVVNLEEFKKLMKNEANSKWFSKMVDDDEIFKVKKVTAPAAAPAPASASKAKNTEAEKLFNKYKDGSFITKESLVKIMDKKVEERAKKIIKKADKDSNSIIDKKEMEKLMKVEQDAAWFNKMVDVFSKK